jgi:peptidoglycan/LPS O-acetylase OafA/YrhL
LTHRSNNIDAIRLLLSVGVLFSHCYRIAQGYEENEPLLFLTGGQVSLGAAAVAAFFALSGYLIAGSWERSSSWRSFASRRIRRIYPGYLVAVFACILAFPFNVRWTTLVRMGLLQGVPQSPTLASNPFPGFVNLSLWTIPYEAWTYAGIAAMGVMGLLRRPRFLVALLVLAIVNSTVFSYYQLAPNFRGLGSIIGWLPHWARLLPPIMAGALLHAAPRLLTWNPVAVVLAVCGLVIGASVPMGMLVALPTCGVYLLFCLAFSKPWRWGLLTRHGDLSYGIYLYSFLIQQSIMHAIGHTIHPYQLFALSFPPTVAAAIASWFLVERPMLGTRKARPAVVSATSAVGPNLTT